VDGDPLTGGIGRDVRPLDDPEDMVSSESVPCSKEFDTRDGSGGTTSAGANIPFFVVAVDRELKENSPLALGADATRRMKRDAEAPTDLGERAAFVRDLEGVVGLVNDACDGSAVSGIARGCVGLRDKFIRCLSDLVCVRGREEGPADSASVDLGCCGCRYGGYERFCGPAL